MFHLMLNAELFLRHRILWIFSACLTTLVWSTPPELNTWPNLSDLSPPLPLSFCYHLWCASYYMYMKRYFTPSFWQRQAATHPIRYETFGSHLLTFPLGHMKKKEMQSFIHLYKNNKPLPGTWFQHMSKVSFLFKQCGSALPEASL